MNEEKITPSHLERTAYVYLRQSTMAQVREHRGSTERQYDQVKVAQEFGWSENRVEVIDEDLGKSGTGSQSRPAFQNIVTQVATGKAGALFAIEVSRLSRSNANWYRLLDLCAANDTLVIDEGRVHDPATYDDRLLLGLKGTISDAEWYIMRSRLNGGRYRKALDGTYRMNVGIGFIWDENGRLVKDPDESIRSIVEEFFRTFEVLRCARGVVKSFCKRGLSFPKRIRTNGCSLVEWGPLSAERALYVLRNPLYAGVYSYGRMHKKKPRWAGNGPWPVLLKDHVEGYITWEDFVKNKKRLEENRSTPVTSGAPKGGQALLQGIVFCRRCGRRMSVAYDGAGRKYVRYLCRAADENSMRHVCVSVTGNPIDRAIARRCLEVLNRENVEKAIELFREVDRYHQDEAKLWEQQVEAAEYEAERAFRQYNAVEPENRLVTRTLERCWEEKLRAIEKLKEDYSIWLQDHPSPLGEGERERLLELVHDFRRVWDSPTTTQEERKALIRLLLKDVMVARDSKKITLYIRWYSGKLETIRISNDNAPNSAMQPDVIERIRKLSGTRHDSKIAEELNQQGYRTARNLRFTARIVGWIRHTYGIKKGHRDETGYITAVELASRIGVSSATIITWCEKGMLDSTRQGKHCTYWIKISEEEIEELSGKVRRRNRRHSAKSLGSH